MNVKDRQCLLTFLKKADGTSYYTGEVDGIYGRLSRKAIQDFQNDFGGLILSNLVIKNTSSKEGWVWPFNLILLQLNRSDPNLPLSKRRKFATFTGGL